MGFGILSARWSLSFSYKSRQHIPRSSDDLSSTALFDHLLGGRAIAVKNAEHVHLEHMSDVFFSKIKQCFDLCNPGVGDHYIQGSQFLHALLDKLFDLLQVGDIGYMADRVAPHFLDLGDCLYEELPLALRSTFIGLG